MTAQAQATAVLAALNAALPASVRAYDLDDVPSPRPANYVEVTISRRFGGERRLTQQTGVIGWRIAMRAVSQTSVGNARVALERCRKALEFKPLTVAGETSTGVQFETEDPADYDDGWFSGLYAMTYTIKESL